MSSILAIIKRDKWVIFSLLAIFVLFTLLLPDSTPPGRFDRSCWISWANYIDAHGLQNIYKFGVDYLPLFHYFLFVFAKLSGGTEGIIANINYLKLVTLFCDLIGVYYAYLIIRPTFKNIITASFAVLALPLNISFFYNNIIYGQVDGVYTAMTLISLYYGIKKMPIWSFLFMVLAINLKLQAIIFVPIVLLINISNNKQNITLKNVLNWVWPTILVQTIIILPFALVGDLDKAWHAVHTAMGRYERVSMNAYSFWVPFFKNPFTTHDGTGIWGLSYNSYGLLLFVGASALAIWPLFWQVFNYVFKKSRTVTYPLEKVFLIAGIVAIVFFYFNTQMHSRYVHPAVVFLGVYAIYTRRFLPYILFSCCYFFNIEGGAKILKGNIVPYKWLVFQPWFVSFFYGITVIILFVLLYSKPRRSSTI